MQANSRGRRRAAERGGDLLQRHVPEVVQEQHTPRPRRNLTGGVEQALVGDLLIVSNLHTVRLEGWFEGVEQRGDGYLDVAFGTGSGTPDVIPPDVQGDPSRPGGQRRRATVAREAAQEVDEGFLRQIVGQICVACAARQAANQFFPKASCGLGVEPGARSRHSP
ncbi:MAG: hypothetical protein U0807_12125 [Candidatus Binatia bacterium]